MGWWANLVTGADVGTRRIDLRHAFSRVLVPLLILRGGCDYIRWEAALQYKTAFRNSTLLYVPDAGHAFGYDQPQIYAAAVRAFLLDRPLPIAPYESTVAPPGLPRGAKLP
jgi:proline iminopeptidase